MTSMALLLVSAAGAANASQGVLLDFTATWCGPCQQMKPVVSRLVRQGYPIRKINVDAHPDLVRKYRVNGIPAFVLVVNGKEVTRVVGYASERRLKQLLSRIPKPRKKKPVSPRPPVSNPLPIAKSSTDNAAVRLVKNVRNRFRLPFLPKKRNRERAIDQPAAPLKNAIVRAKLDSREPKTARVVRDIPMAASARIRVNDGGGVNYGSGTVIDSRVGRTIVLTCGHIFRGLKESSTIEVDVFDGARATTYVGTALRYNLKADVGLIAIPTQSPIAAAHVATLENAAGRGDHVFSIGCGGGKVPSKLQLRVTALNRYLGPDNIECTGVPEQGRSGGGLFSTTGEIVGVCFAADRRDRRGLYASLKPIHQLLSESGLDRVIGGGRAGNTKALARSSEPIRSNDRLQAPAVNSRALGDREPRLAMPASARANAQSSVESEFVNRMRAEDSGSRLKTVADVFRRSSEAEVICVIRPLSDPQAASRVVIINRASEKFVEYLNNELRDQPVATTKSMKQPSAFTRSARRVPTRRIARDRPSPARQVSEPGRYRRSRASR